jgi:heme-degrading monooxygenase HmoA
MVFATVTTTDTGGEPLTSATIIAEEMERWLRDLEGFQGFLLLANDEQALGITFWASREVAERFASTRSTFRERALSIAGVRIEEVVDYDVAFARLTPGFAVPAT